MNLTEDLFLDLTKIFETDISWNTSKQLFLDFIVDKGHIYICCKVHIYSSSMFLKLLYFFLFAVSGKWYTTGISKGGFGCVTPPEYAVFTKVAVYRNWIIEQLLENSEPW